MDESRRNFLLAGLIATLGTAQSFGKTTEKAEDEIISILDGETDDEFDPEVFDFFTSQASDDNVWKNEFRAKVLERFGASSDVKGFRTIAEMGRNLTIPINYSAGKRKSLLGVVNNYAGQSNKAITASGSREITPTFFHFNKEAKIFRPVREIDRSRELIEAKDAEASITISSVKWGQTDEKICKNDASGAYLRCDVMQANPEIKAVDLLVWSVTSVILPKESIKFPTFSVGSNPNVPVPTLYQQPQSFSYQQFLPLTNGVGSWNCNLMIQKKKSFLQKLIEGVAKYNVLDVIRPLLGIPGLTAPMAKNFQNIFGLLSAKLENKRTQFVLKSKPIPLLATKNDLFDLDYAPYLPLVRGAYIICAESDSARMRNILTNADINVVGGAALITEKGTERPHPELNDITYIVMEARTRKKA